MWKLVIAKHYAVRAYKIVGSLFRQPADEDVILCCGGKNCQWEALFAEMSQYTCSQTFKKQNVPSLLLYQKVKYKDISEYNE